MKAKILWVERKRAEGPSFVSSLQKKGFGVEVVPTGNAALERLPDYDPDLVVVNAASLHSNGRRICRSLRDRVNGMPIVLINSAGKALADNACANAVLVLPFTARKLINRITPLLPGKGENILQVGPIQLDQERRLVSSNGRDMHMVTPHQAHLLQILMEHPGEVLERRQLFIQVWETDYTVDTRTLDVHISWLRRVLEPDPRNPLYIKTIRGVGYRLDV